MSNIDITVPVYGNPTTQSVRDNFAVAKTEIEALQSVVASGPYLPLAGGTLTGLLTLSGPPTAALHAATKAYVDLRLLLSGGTMTGLLTLSGPPTANLHAATKAYVDTGDATAVLLAGSTMTGPLVLSGDATLALGAATKQQVDAVATVAAGMLPIAGGTMTGPLILSGAPVDPLGAATKAYADTKLPLAGGVLTGALSLSGPPSSGLHATTKSYVDSAVTNAGVGVYLPIAGGVLTGPLTLAADPGSAMHAATKQYVDAFAGNYLPLTGGTLTGALTATVLTSTGAINATAAVNANNVVSTVGGTFGSATGTGIINLIGASGSVRQIKWFTGGTSPATNLRWLLSMTTTAEDGSNIGTDWLLTRYSDTGSNLGNVLGFSRATGLATIYSGLAFPNAVATTVTDLSKHLQLYAGWGINMTSGRMNIIGTVTFVTASVDRLTIANTVITSTIPILLPADPTNALHAATKQYVDSGVGGVTTSLANYVLLSGGTMTGLLTLSGAPTAGSHAATKTYVDTADNLRLLLAGGVMTGLLTLSGPPTVALHAATKAYVDSQVSGITGFLPLSGGTMTGPITLPGDPVGNLQAATKGYVDNKVPPGGPFVPINGATMTGFLTLNADPTSNLHAATKAYVDSKTSATGTYLPLTGGTLTGPLVLAADPNANMQAATKQYVDNKVPPGGPFLPISGGTVTGSLTVSGNLVAATLEGQVLFVRQGSGNGLTVSVSGQSTDPIQFSGSGSGGAVFNMPLRVVQDPVLAMGVATKQYVDNSFANNTQFLLLTGGTMTGPLVLSGNPTATNQAANKAYVDALSTSISTTYLPLAGGVLTGFLTLSGGPTNDLHAATKAYVDSGDAASLATVAGLYLPLAGGNLSGGITFTGAIATTNNDFSKHINLNGGLYGISVQTGSRLNVGSNGTIALGIVGVDRITITPGLVAIGDGTTNGDLRLRGLSTQFRGISWQAGTTSRWALYCPANSTETGTGNTGSDLLMVRYADDGSSLGTLLNINRSTGLITFSSSGVSFGNAVAPTTSDLSRHIALFSTNYGICVSSGRMNIVGGQVGIVIGTTDVAIFSGTGLNNCAIGATTQAAANFNTVTAGRNLANYFTIAGANANSPPTITATGSDANIDISLVPKGTGVVRLPSANMLGGLMDGVSIGAIGGAASDMTLDLDFMRGVLDPRITFTRASVATYYDRNGALQTAAVNEPRFEYDPVTLQPRGLLVEEARTNFLLNSGAPATQTTGSLTTGTYILWVVGTGTATSSANTAVGSGFGAAVAGTPNVITITTAGTIDVTVTGTLTRFQLEKCISATQVYATSYIPTTSATVARAADITTLTTTGWINASGTTGSLMVEALKLGAAQSSTEYLVGLTKTSVTDRVALYVATNNNSAAIIYYNGALVYGSVIGGQEPLNVPYRAAFAFQDGAQYGCVNGGNIYAPGPAPTITPGFTNMVIGQISVGTTVYNGYIRRVRYWPRVLSNTELQQVTKAASIQNVQIDQSPIGDVIPARGTFTTIRLNNNAGPTWTAAAGAPTTVQPIGSIYSRTDGTVGNTLYVRGASSWAPVAAV